MVCGPGRQGGRNLPAVAPSNVRCIFSLNGPFNPSNPIWLIVLPWTHPDIFGSILGWQRLRLPFPTHYFHFLHTSRMGFQLLAAIALAYFGWSMVCLERNVRKAQSLGIPAVRLPIDPVNFLWVFLQGHVWRMLDCLPIAWSSYPDFIRFSYRGWHFREKSGPAVRFGPVWALVTPVTFYLQFADPDAINELFSRRSDFIRPVKNYSEPSQSCLNAYVVNIADI